MGFALWIAAVILVVVGIVQLFQARSSSGSCSSSWAAWSGLGATASFGDAERS